MLPINDYAAFERRQAELLKKAEVEQLLRQARHNGSGTLSRRSAFWLGALLIQWGQNLERFGTRAHSRHAASISARSLPL